MASGRRGYGKRENRAWEVAEQGMGSGRIGMGRGRTGYGKWENWVWKVEEEGMGSGGFWIPVPPYLLNPQLFKLCVRLQ